jgi:serine protease AprX
MRREPVRNTVRRGSLLVLGALVLFADCLAFATPQKFSSELAGIDVDNQVDIIVQYRQAPTPQLHQKIIQRGGTLRQELGLVRGAVYRVPASALAYLAADPEVVYVSPDRVVHGAAISSPAPLLDYHTDAANAPAAWAQGLDGTGIGVAVIDSGISDIPDLHGRKFAVAFSQNFVSDGLASAGALDPYGHGSHVAGIIAGNGTNSNGANYLYTFKGVAPGVNLVSLRVLDQNGQGTDSQVIAAIETAIRLKKIYNIRVINLSVGRGVFESYKLDPLCQAVEQAWAAGIVVVVAAGNEGRNTSLGTYGYGTITAPGNDPYVITVGAMNTMGTPDRTDDVPTSYSSRGPTLWDHVIKPDLVAPGNRTISLYTAIEVLARELPDNPVPNSAYTKNGNGKPSDTYFYLSGTSMATPMVSGAAALLLQKNPLLTPDQVKARLMKRAFKNLIRASIATDPTTGQTFNLQADIFTVGAGYLDIKAALANNDMAPATMGSAMSPGAALDRKGNVVLVPNGPSLLGGPSVVWNTNSVYGESVLWGTNASAQSILWGTATLAGESILWGTNATTASSILWGTSVLWGTASTGRNPTGQGDVF